MIREHLREEVEDTLARRCAVVLYEVHHPALIDMTRDSSLCNNRGSILPLTARQISKKGKFLLYSPSPGVKGIRRKMRSTWSLSMRKAGMRENAQVENLSDTDNEAQFRDLLKRRRPDVIVVGGYTISTTNLANA